MHVIIRAAKDSKILELSLDSMKEIEEKHSRKKFMKALDRYQNKIVKQPTKYPLDYVAVLPKINRDEGYITRQNKLKNTIMNVVIKNREIKNRPKLSDFMQVYREQKEENPELSKDHF